MGEFYLPYIKMLRIYRGNFFKAMLERALSTPLSVRMSRRSAASQRRANAGLSRSSRSGHPAH